MRRDIVLVSAAVAVVALGPLALAAGSCGIVAGNLHADLFTLPTCQQGIFLCARVALTGDLAPRSDFVFTSLGKGNVTDPHAFTYTGHARVSAQSGHMTTDDSGRIEYDPTGPSPFHTVGTITGGDGIYHDATGVVQVTGVIDFQAQTGDGDYVGVVCVPA